MTTKHLILIDVLGPKGHARINSAIEVYYGSNIVTGEELNKRGVKMLSRHYRALLANEFVVLISFDTISLFFLLPVILFKGKKLTAIVHNNLDLASSSKFHFINLFLLSRFVDFVFLTDYIKSHARRCGIFGRTIDFIVLDRDRHFKVSEKVVIDNKIPLKCAFVHGRVSKDEILNSNVDWVFYDTVFCNNTELKYVYSNWVCDYFDDLNGILLQCQDFYFLKEMNFRQYSILFELLEMNGIRIFIKDEMLYSYVRNLNEVYQLNIQVIWLKT